MSEQELIPKPAKADWAMIEPEVHHLYAETTMPIDEIAAKFGVSKNAVYIRATRNKWKRMTPSSSASDGAHREANHAMVEKLRDHGEEIPEQSDDDIAGVLAGRVLKKHRSQLNTLRSAVKILSNQLVRDSKQTDIIDERLEEYFLLKAEGDPLRAAMYRQQLNQALAAVSLGSRSKTLLNLTSAMAKVIELERKSYRFDDEGEMGEYEKALALLQGKKHLLTN